MKPRLCSFPKTSCPSVWPPNHGDERHPKHALLTDGMQRSPVTVERSEQVAGRSRPEVRYSVGVGTAARNTERMMIHLPSEGGGLTRGLPISLCSSSSSWLTGLASAA